MLGHSDLLDIHSFSFYIFEHRLYIYIQQYHQISIYPLHTETMHIIWITSSLRLVMFAIWLPILWCGAARLQKSWIWILLEFLWLLITCLSGSCWYWIWLYSIYHEPIEHGYLLVQLVAVDLEVGVSNRSRILFTTGCWMFISHIHDFGGHVLILIPIGGKVNCYSRVRGFCQAVPANWDAERRQKNWWRWDDGRFPKMDRQIHRLCPFM